MKKLLSFIIAGTIIFLASTTSNAQDFCKTDPAFIKVLTDTTYVAALEVTFEPGKQTNMHTHPASFVYALTGGKLKVDYADGETQTFELKTGESFLLAPDRPHRSTNIGTGQVKLLLVELKEHPYLASKKMNN